MDQNKNFSTESGKTTGNNPSTTGSTQSRTSNTIGNAPNTHSTSGHVGDSGNIGAQAASATQRAKDTAQTAYDQTKQVVNDAYSKTSEVLSTTYDQTMTYGRENPGKLTLIAFGAGIGIGLLLAGTLGGGRSRTNRIAEPIVGALSQVAMEFFR
ncbi:MAG TPA: hypothetical protein VLR90_08275 [Blastocatellia bacterium]|nr:hypothetical protein [Blastocatellia bacterium]